VLGKTPADGLCGGFCNSRFWVKNGGGLVDYRFLIMDNCLLVCGVSGCGVGGYGFAIRVFGSGMC